MPLIDPNRPSRNPAATLRATTCYPFRASLLCIGISFAGCAAADDPSADSGVHVDPGTPKCIPGVVGCIPSRPEAATSDPTDARDLTFALRDLLVDQRNPAAPPAAQMWRYIGFDLDGIVTAAPGGANGCRAGLLPDGGPSVDGFPVDGNMGIDNQFGAALAPLWLPIVDANLQSDVCCMQAHGRGTLLVRIRGWNGQPDDALVTLSLVSAFDGTADDAANLAYRGGSVNGYVQTADGVSEAAPPSWAPDADTWFANSSSLSSGNLDAPRHVDIDGYVRGGYLVMRLDPTQPIPLYLGSSAGVSLVLRQATLVAHVSNSQRVLDDGWIAGRLRSTELLDVTYGLSARDLYSTFASTGSGSTADNALACEAVANLTLPLASTVSDVLSNGTNDANTPCDAISVGLAFHGVRAKNVVAAPASLTVPMPDCVGHTAAVGTVTSDEATCPFKNSSANCIRAWDPLL